VGKATNPIMVKIDLAEVVRAGKSVKPVGLTLFVNWAVKPFTMYGFGLDLPVGASHGGVH